MIVFKNLKDVQANAPPEVKEEIVAFCTLGDNPVGDNTFMDHFGGDMHLVETVEDLDKIETYIESEVRPGRWATLREKPDSFDICEILPSGNYVHIWYATNNAGGPGFYIPKAVCEQCSHVFASVTQTHGGLHFHSVKETLERHYNKQPF